MRQIIKRNPMAVVLAVTMHLLIITFMLVGVDWLEKPTQPKSNVEVVQARVVDQAKVAAEVERLKKDEKARKAKQEATLRKEEKRLANLKKRQQAEKARLAKLEKKRKAEEKAEAKRRTDAKKKIDTEKKRLADLEKKHKAEQKKAAAAKAKQEAEAKRKVEEEKKRKAREEELQASVEMERVEGLKNRYVPLIQQYVSRNWLQPTIDLRNLKCTIRARLIPGGDVVPNSVTVVKSSGNAIFDRSVVSAVYKASPLPVPSGSDFGYMRNITFIFDPHK